MSNNVLTFKIETMFYGFTVHTLVLHETIIVFYIFKQNLNIFVLAMK